MATTTPSDDNRVRRRLRFQGWRPECTAVAEALQRHEGVHRIQADETRARITVDYDVLETGFEQLQGLFSEGGCPLAMGWTARLRWALYRYLDENARANARHRPAPCCSNPSELYTRKHK